MYQEEIDSGGDTATAVADHLLFFRHAACLDFSGRISKGSEPFGRGIDEGCRRHVDAAGHASGAAVSAGLQAAMELRAKRVHDHGAWSANGGSCLVLVHEQRRP